MPASRRVLFSFGDLTTSVPMTIVNFYQLWFLTDVAGLPPAQVGWALGAAKIWDAVNDPLIGLWIDRGGGRMGRRRGPLALAAPCLSLAFVLVWLVPPLPTAALALYYALAIMLFDTAYTVFHVSYNGMTPELAPDYDGRSSLNGIRMAFSLGGAILSVVLLTLLAPLVPEGRTRFALVGLVLGILSGLPAFAVLAATKGLDDSGPERGAAPALRESLAAVLGNRPFLRVTLVYFLTWTTATLISTVLVYFVSYRLRAPGQANYLILTAQVSAIAFIPLVVRLCRALDKRRALMLGCAAWMAVQLGISAAGPGALVLCYLLAALMGFGIATAYVVPWAMLPDTIDSARAATGARLEGSHYAFAAFFQKLGTAAAMWLVAQALAATGYRAPSAAEPLPVQPEAAVTAIRLALGLVPLVLLGAAILAASGYGLGRREQREARAAIEPAAEA